MLVRFKFLIPIGSPFFIIDDFFKLGSSSTYGNKDPVVFFSSFSSCLKA
jgi:hypothetical protein